MIVCKTAQEAEQVPGVILVNRVADDQWQAFVEGDTLPAQPPPPTVPASVPRLKARKALAFAGIFAQVQPAIDAITDPVQRALAQVLWEDSPTFDRNDPVLIQLARNMGLSDAAVDSLFIQANALPD